MFKTQPVQANGKTYLYYVYENEHMKLIFSQLGGTIIDWKTKNMDGAFESIVMSYANAESYHINDKSLGATVGPYAGRIFPSKLELSHGTYELDSNFLNHSTLHSAKDNFQSKLCDVEVVNDHLIIFKTTHDDQNTKYPGQTSYEMVFEIDQNTLHQTYRSFAKKDTYTNLTNHTYFNLSGNLKNDILNHHLIIPASTYGDLNEFFLTQSLSNVEDTIFDFRKPKPLKETVLTLKDTAIKGLDHPFMLEKGPIILKDPYSHRVLEIHTDQDSVVLYTNNFLTEASINHRLMDEPFLAVCLETQHFPNDVHFFKEPFSFHKKDTIHIQKTSYKVYLETL